MKTWLVTGLAWVGLSALTVWNFGRDSSLAEASTAYGRQNLGLALQRGLDRLERHPNDSEAALIVARCLSLRVFPQEAESYYEIAQQAAPLSLADWEICSQGWSRTYLFDKAISIHEQEIAFFPKHAPAIKRLAILQKHAGQLRQAYQTAKFLGDLPGLELEGATLALLMALETNMGDSKTQVEIFDRYLKANPNLNNLPASWRDFWMGYGIALQHAADTVRLRQLMSRALEQEEHPELIDLLGISYFLEGQFDQAAEQFRRAMAIRPNRGSPYYYLGRVAIAQNQSLKASELLEKANQLFPNNYEIVYNLGIAHRMAGHAEQAQKWLDRARELRPKEATSGGMGSP